MYIRIFQINLDRDENNRCFRGYDELPRSEVTGEAEALDSSIYDLVFAGEVDCKSLEDVYELFNTNHPGEYKGRSLSVSDVVEVQKENGSEVTYHFCDSIGFCDVSFDPEQAQVSPNILRIEPEKKEKRKPIDAILIKPGQRPEVVSITPDLDTLQEIVEGDIEYTYPFLDPVAIICNEEHKLLGLPFNRVVDIEQPPEKVDSWTELKEQFTEYEANREKVMREGGQKILPLTGYVTFSQDSFDKEYSEESRTYVFSSDNKMFHSKMLGNSLYGDCLDGSEEAVRLDWYMYDDPGWKIESCAIQEPPVSQDILQGNILLVGLNETYSEVQSFPWRLMEKYLDKFADPTPPVELLKDVALDRALKNIADGLLQYTEAHKDDRKDKDPEKDLGVDR